MNDDCASSSCEVRRWKMTLVLTPLIIMFCRDLGSFGIPAFCRVSKQSSQRFRIRSLRIGSLELRDVVASVAPIAGSLLLGQSFLSRIKSWSIDNERHLLVLNQPPIPGKGDTTVAQSAARSVQHPTMAQSNDTALLNAVAFALIGDDGRLVTVVDRANCVFEFADPAIARSVVRIHLNNVDPKRITIDRSEDQTRIVVHIWGQNHVVDFGHIDINGNALFGPEIPPIHWTHDSTYLIDATTDYQLTVRAWKYIYSNGCTGRESSF